MDEPRCFSWKSESGWPVGSVGEGWWPIVIELEDALDEACPGWKLSQIKEKFGGLRFYAGFPKKSFEKGQKLIAEAERKAVVTCENCGKPGYLNDEGWAKTLCDNCDRVER